MVGGLPSGGEAGFFSFPLNSSQFLSFALVTVGLADVDARARLEADLPGWWMGKERLVVGRLLAMGCLGPQWPFGIGLGLTVIMVEGCYPVWEGASVSSFLPWGAFDSAVLLGGGERRACPFGLAYPEAPILTFPRRGEGIFGLLHSFFWRGPIPFALSGVERSRRVGVGLISGPSTPFRMRGWWGGEGLPIEDGLPGGPHPNLPPAGGRDFWFTSH